MKNWQNIKAQCNDTPTTIILYRVANGSIWMMFMSSTYLLSVLLKWFNPIGLPPKQNVP